ncbi:MAG TPA: class I SAM-dependent methyltransferase [Cyclobacteriaceae bacterium]
MSIDLIQQLLSPAIQSFIYEHEHDDVKTLLLKHSSIEGLKTSLIVEQINGRSKAKFKLPQYYKTPGILYPPGLNLEQCSSEATAKVKSQHIAKGMNMLDLTGGFGVDTYYLSKQFENATYVEPDTDLLMITRHNHHVLGAKNIEHINCTAEEFLDQDKRHYDLIFIDPSRRNANQKVYKLADCIPDITTLQKTIFERTDSLLVKTSPLLDLHQGLKELSFVKDIIVVSVDNECKEVLFSCVKGFRDTPVIKAINIIKEERQDLFSFTFSDEQASSANLSDPLQFLYEPNASILKAGAFKILSERFTLSKIHTNTHLYTSQTLMEDFPGRIFRIEAFVKPEEKMLKQYFPEGKVNITTRNYQLTVEELKKKTRLKDGGDKFLIGFNGINQKYLVVASRVK